MAKRSASSDCDALIQQLMTLRDDPGKVWEALATQDVSTAGVLVAKLLGIASSIEEAQTAKRRKLVSECPQNK